MKKNLLRYSLWLLTLILLPVQIFFTARSIATPPLPLPLRSTNLQIDAGYLHTCGVGTDSMVHCWGYDLMGQGNPPTDLGMAKTISAGYEVNCALKIDSSVRCWGINSAGQGTVPNDLGTVISISAGSFHTCVVKTDHTVRCWGDNSLGQTSVPVDLETVIMLSAGHNHTCAVTTENEARCWGDNSDSQTTVPLDLGAVAEVSAGWSYTCALKIDNTVRCWGRNDFAQTTIPDNLGTVSAISAGIHHTCALKTDGMVRCWGRNDLAQTTIPDDLGTVSTVTIGVEHTCAVKTDNTVRCWGSDTQGQSSPPVPKVQLELAGSPLSEAGGIATIVANLSDYAWTNVIVGLAFSGTSTGNGVDYQVSVPSVTLTTGNLTGTVSLTGVDDTLLEGRERIFIDIDSVIGGKELSIQQVIAIIIDDEPVPTFTPTPIPTENPSVFQIDAGNAHTCGIRMDKTIRCWGSDSSGQSSVPGNVGIVRTVSAGEAHTCAVKIDNTVRCWGSNSDGQRTVPADLGMVSAVSAGKYHTCAVKIDNTVRCWGINQYGQSTVPADLWPVIRVSAGGRHTCALESDDVLRCWGDNSYGQSAVPPDLGMVSAVSSGEYHTCALRIDNTVQCWGSNNYGQIMVPEGLGSVTLISTESNHTCVVKTDNTVRCWGDSSYGQSTVPSDLGMVIAISAGTYHTCAVTIDNLIRCWGSNSDGQTIPTPPLVTLELIGSPLTESAGQATVVVMLSEHPFTNVVANLAYSGTATDGIDYQASDSSILFTPNDPDLMDSISLTVIDDGIPESDETIIVDIDSVDGGTESSVQQVTAIIIGQELVSHGGFENDFSPWLLKNATGEKIKCNQPYKPVAYSGICAFLFKGGSGENSKLEQIIDLNGETFMSEDSLKLYLYLNAQKSTVSGKIKINVHYSDGTSQGKFSLDLNQTSGYQQLTGGYTLTSAAVSKIKLQIKHTSRAGKVYIDDVSLLHAPAGGAPSSILLPVP